MTPTQERAIERVLLVARTQRNVTECPPNTNRGLKVQDYLAAVHLPPGQPWCAAWVNWCGSEALGRTWPVPLAGGCETLHLWAVERGVWRTAPTTGVIFLQFREWDQGGIHHARYAHTGFVLSRETAGRWATLEGNTSGGGSREGWGVFPQHRSWGPKDGFVYWWELLTED